MNTIKYVNSADFKASLSKYLDYTYNGEQVMITRKDQAFIITPFYYKEFTITPELEAKLENSRKQIAEDKGIHFDNKEELNAWLDSL